MKLDSKTKRDHDCEENGFKAQFLLLWSNISKRKMLIFIVNFVTNIAKTQAIALVVRIALDLQEDGKVTGKI